MAEASSSRAAAAQSAAGAVPRRLSRPLHAAPSHGSVWLRYLVPRPLVTSFCTRQFSSSPTQISFSEGQAMA
jgi:hypothetical protein